MSVPLQVMIGELRQAPGWGLGAGGWAGIVGEALSLEGYQSGFRPWCWAGCRVLNPPLDFAEVGTRLLGKERELGDIKSPPQASSPPSLGLRVGGVPKIQKPDVFATPQTMVGLQRSLPTA